MNTLIRLVLSFFLMMSVMDVTGAPDLKGRVIQVIDGDSLKMMHRRKQVNVQLADVVAPVKDHPYSAQSKQALMDRVLKQVIRVEVVSKGRFGWYLGRVWLGEQEIAAELLREGHVRLFPGASSNTALMEMEQAARDRNAGLWSLERSKVDGLVTDADLSENQ